MHASLLLSEALCSGSLLLESQLIGQLPSSLCGSSTTNDGGIAIEVLGDFFKRSVTGFNVEEPNNNEFDAEPGAVEDIVFPAEMVKSNGVDVLIEEHWESLVGEDN
jgi:hypothetical protein